MRRKPPDAIRIPCAKGVDAMQPAARTDQILPATRWVAILVIPFLVVAFAILFVVPTRTGELFAWKLQPTMTAMMLASAYAGGVVFFAHVLMSKEWHRVKVGFPPVTTFASVMGVATVLHWDRFNHGHVSFWAWAGLYFTTPFIVLAVWLRNRQLDPETMQPGDRVVPLWVRIMFGTMGAATLVIAAGMFLVPATLIPVWPWAVTPLTARVVSAMFSLPGLVGLGLAFDRRWSAVPVILQAQGFSIALILVAAARAWNEFKPDAGKWVFVGGLIAMLVAIVGFSLWMRASARPNVRAT
jgi:hypothetical protein